MLETKEILVYEISSDLYAYFPQRWHTHIYLYSRVNMA